MDNDEYLRLMAMTYYEREWRTQGKQIIAGVDEAGRGPLAGPVVAAACCIPPDRLIPGVDDSKKLTPKKRDDLYQLITSDPTIKYSIQFVDVETIDKINIYQATILAMTRALDALKPSPHVVLMDGMKFPHPQFEIIKLVQGDQKSLSIAAASILAKVTRDRYMEKCDEMWPEYGFKRHKGYGTEAHLEALSRKGPCPLHRRSYGPVKGLCKGQDFLAQ